MQKLQLHEKRYSLLKLLGRYLWYVLHSGTRHSVHSPTVFELIEKLHGQRSSWNFDDIETIRKELKANIEVLEITDYGDGGRRKRRTVREIAKTSLKPPSLARSIAVIAGHLGARNAMELGSSFGITSAYIARSIKGDLYTFEGDERILEIAMNGWQKLGISNIKSFGGPFAQSLDHALPNLPKMDLIFVDGHHQKEPTLTYFKQCLGLCTNETVLIFDDIHWSKAMEEAWSAIQETEEVRCTVDLFWLGLVFLKKELSKQHYILRY